MFSKKPKKKRIPVTVDKTHLITIGERLYTEKTSFIRELVNNAFDADATEVHVRLGKNRIVIADNGSGMNEDGLRKYFTIGASEKRGENSSPRFGRKRIGEYGIGKFSALAMSDRFEILTRKGDFYARLIFDKKQWQQHEDWHLNVEVLGADAQKEQGTTIILHEPSITLPAGTVKRYLSERAPIHAPHFAVFVDGERVTSQVLTGKRFPIHVKTRFGSVEGVLVIVPPDRKLSQTGIAVHVKQVLIRYELFGLDRVRKLGSRRISGMVNADFLPITSSRDDFLRDHEAFKVFSEAMSKEVKKVLASLRIELDRKANLQASRVLKNAMQKIGKAMKRHEKFFPVTRVPVERQEGERNTSGPGYSISNATFIPTGEKLDQDLFSRIKKSPKKRKASSSVLLGNKSIVRHLSVAGVDIAVRMEHLGEAEEESIVSGGIIYINLDHPLYRTYRNNDELLQLHIARILTKEIALTTDVRDAAQAFGLQSELLTEAFRERRKSSKRK